MIDQCDTYNKNTDVLGNAVELGASILSRIHGEEIASSVQGQAMTNTAYAQLLASKLQAKFAAVLANGSST